jgi:hypothetical protein
MHQYARNPSWIFQLLLYAGVSSIGSLWNQQHKSACPLLYPHPSPSSMPLSSSPPYPCFQQIAPLHLRHQRSLLVRQSPKGSLTSRWCSLISPFRLLSSNHLLAAVNSIRADHLSKRETNSLLIRMWKSCSKSANQLRLPSASCPGWALAQCS